MPPLKISLLGSPLIELDGQPLIIRRRKVLALLVYLATNPQPHQRDFLADLLWPGYDQSSARANLRKAVSVLNQQLDQKWLDIQREQINLVRDEELWLDIDQFRTLINSAISRYDPNGPAPSTLLELLNQASELYRADFLTGFSLPDTPEFTDWQLIQAEKLRRRLAQLCETLSQCYARNKEWEPALLITRRWLSLDTLEEKAHRELMRLLAANGQRNAALRQYEHYREILAADLGVEPTAATIALFEEIRQGRTVQVNKPDLTPGVKPAAPHINLPPRLTTFIGRQEEVAEITRLLVEEPGCRHLTLFGLGGVGKTRLAIEVAAAAGPFFSDGVTFVSLAGIERPDSLVPSILEALGLRDSGTHPEKTLLDYLHNKAILLVLDNFEHLNTPPGTGLLIEILLAASHVKLLVTSRYRLNLEQEWSMEVLGMRWPPDDQLSLAEIASYEAIQLFVQRARRVRQAFALSTQNRVDVVRICRLVDGMPLGIELAAAWLRLFSCQEIAQEIEKNLDFLSGSNLNVPQRLHSLRAAFEYSWQLLPEEEQAHLRRLSVFRGGFTDWAAQRVTGAPLPVLVSLVDKALLRRTRNRRYQIHELLRQFAAEKLEQHPEDREKTQDRHAEFFLTFVQQLMDKREERTIIVQREILEAFVADDDNVWLAWYHALDRRQDHSIGKAALGLYDLCHIAGCLSEGSQAFRQAVDVLSRDQASTTPLVLGRLLRGYGFIHTWLGDLAQAQKLLEQSVSVLRHAEEDSPADLAHSLYELSMACMVQGLYDQTARHAQDSLTLFTQCQDRYQMGLATQMLGWVKTYQAEYEAGIDYLKRSIHLLQTKDGALGVRGGYSKQFLATIARLQGDYEKAGKIIDELIENARAAGTSLDLGYLLREAGYLSIALGQYDLAQSQIEAGLNLFREKGARAASVLLITEMGYVSRLRGDFETATRLHHEALAIGREIGERRGVAICLDNLGRLALDQKHYQQASAFFNESLESYMQIGHPHGQGTILCQQGFVALFLDPDLPEIAEEKLLKALKISTGINAPPLTLEVLRGFALMWAIAEPDQTSDPKFKRLLTLIHHHPATEQETKDRAKVLWDRSPAETPADFNHLMLIDEANADLDAIAHEILGVFST